MKYTEQELDTHAINDLLNTLTEWVGSRLGGHIAKAKSMISKAKGEA